MRDSSPVTNDRQAVRGTLHEAVRGTAAAEDDRENFLRVRRI